MTRKIHPAAAAYPMLSEDDLRALAADIAANGLLHPIVVDESGAVIDGRNRLAACELAGIEPTFVIHDGDPVTLVLSANSHRRNITQGQRAMSGWLAVNDLQHDDGFVATRVGVSRPMILWARTVAEYAPGRVDDVIHGRAALRDVYEEARRVRDERDADERALDALPDDLAVLVRSGVRTLVDAQAEADLRDRVADLDDDLAERVHDGALAIDSAEESMRQRVANIRDSRERAVAALRLLRNLAGNPLPDPYLHGYGNARHGKVTALEDDDLELLQTITKEVTA